MNETDIKPIVSEPLAQPASTEPKPRKDLPPGSAWLPLAVFADLFAQIRAELRLSWAVLSKQTGIPEQVIEKWETRDPGSLLIEQVVLLLYCLDCRLEIRPVRNNPRVDEPFEALRRK